MLKITDTKDNNYNNIRYKNLVQEQKKREILEIIDTKDNNYDKIKYENFVQDQKNQIAQTLNDGDEFMEEHWISNYELSLIIEQGITEDDALKILAEIKENGGKKGEDIAYLIKHGINNDEAKNLLTKIYRLNKINKNVLDCFATYSGVDVDEALKMLDQINMLSTDKEILDYLTVSCGIEEKNASKILEVIREDEKNKFSAERHGKSEKHYEDVFPKHFWNNLSLYQKEERAKQIDYLEKEVLGDNDIKIRVRPRIIQKFAKLTKVPDFKGGGYWGDTIYLGHTSDLFNPQIVRHEGIHILQQRELGPTRLKGFKNWTIESLFEGPKKYKREHKGKNITPNDLSTKTRLEMEPYSNQLDPEYIENREDNAYLEYDGKEGIQKGLKKIDRANYELDKKNLHKKLSTSNGYSWFQNVHDIRKLEEIKDISKDWDMYVFNYVEKINDILCVIKLLEEKLKELKKLNNSGKLSVKKESDLYDDRKNQYKASPKLKKHIESHKNEIANENLSYMLEDNFISIDAIEVAIKDLYKKCHDYRKTPTFIRLEEDGHHEKTDILGDITAALLKLGYNENSLQDILNKVKEVGVDFDKWNIFEKFGIMAAILKNGLDENKMYEIFDEIGKEGVDFDFWDILEKYGIYQDNLLDILDEVKKERIEIENNIKKQNKKKGEQKGKFITIPTLFHKK